MCLKEGVLLNCTKSDKAEDPFGKIKSYSTRSKRATQKKEEKCKTVEVLTKTSLAVDVADKKQKQNNTVDKLQHLFCRERFPRNKVFSSNRLNLYDTRK